MAANFLTRRLAGLSLSLSKPLSGAPLMRRVAQPSRALSSLLCKGTNEPSSAILSTLHSNHTLCTRAAAFRWMSSSPAVSNSSNEEASFDFDDSADSAVATVDSRWARHGRGCHPDGKFIPPKYRKVKPHIVKRRTRVLKTYIGNEKNIRYSPWRMNLICRFIAGQTVPEAENQLRFVRKRKAPLMRKVLKRTSNLADIRHGLQPSQLEVAECFATHGHHLKRMKIHARGKSGIMHRRHCHIRLVLREIDFPLKIALATTENQKRRWMEKMRLADLDAAEAKGEREELEILEAEAKARRAKEEENK